MHGEITTWSAGSLGGGYWNDESEWLAQNKSNIDGFQVFIRNSNFKGIRARYGGTWTSIHGSSDVSTTTVILGVDEYVIGVDVWSDSLVRGFQLVTNRGQKDIFGNKIGIYSSVRRGKLAYMSGRTGSHIDELTFHWFEGKSTSVQFKYPQGICPMSIWR